METPCIYCTCTIITRGLYIFTPFFTAVYIVEQLLLQTIYVLNKDILQLRAVLNQEWVIVLFQITVGIVKNLKKSQLIHAKQTTEIRQSTI